ncbi:hypothetical protein [Synechococcus sp. PCC 7336]|uniref:hypothetical protein n=1 Tax=Synechococcus sp. PCC 7336 TaxID=195250 RepID=UPI000346F729|nr:hypothetical protein [Synechococcus sp. PCC 7336]
MFIDQHEIFYPDAPFPILEEQIADLETTIREIEEDPAWYAELNCMTLAHVDRKLDRLYCRLEALQSQLEGVQRVEREFEAAAAIA